MKNLSITQNSVHKTAKKAILGLLIPPAPCIDLFHPGTEIEIDLPRINS